MQGGKSVIRLKSSGPPLEVNNTIQKATDSKTGVFSVERCITYTVGNRVLSMTITDIGCAGRVNAVHLNLSEENGKKGSCANLNMRFVRDDRYGVLCNTKSKFSGSYDSFKENYCVPPLPDTEMICYVCRETGSGSCLTLTKKKDDMGSVEKMKVTHAFVIDDELTYNVSIKMTNNKRVGLNVEVEAPMKLTMDYNKQLISTIRGKMDYQMDATMLSLFKNSMRQLPKNGTDKEIDSGHGRTYELTVHSKDFNNKIRSDYSG